uniref:FtsW/RodA/SpoVE family cell cycle protein n=1 Tax=Alistipes sp. TaxID=1872444 RepID=UPI004055F7FB
MKRNENENISPEVQEVPSILEKRRLLPGDRVLWVIVVMFFAISMVVVYSASSQLGFREGSTTIYLKKHLVTLGLSAAVMGVCYFVSARLMRKFTWLAYAVSLVMTIIPYFQAARNGAHRWLDLGFFMFQPSELLKIATIMLLAAQLSSKHHIIKRIHLLPTTIDIRKWFGKQQWDIIRTEILPIIAPTALACIAILPDATSSAIHIFIVSMVMLFIAGIRFREIAKFTIVAALCGLTVIYTVGRGDTVTSRVKSWMGIEKSAEKRPNTLLEQYTDSEKARMAIHNGGVFGVGAGRSVMRARLIHPESDYLFGFMIEEFGLLLSFVIVLLYLWIFFRALRIFERCEWLYAGLLAVGLALLVTSQAFLHIGVAIGILPETGQNLPFLTQGRTGMFCASIALGIILSISRQVEQGTLVPPSQQDSNKHI